MDVLYVKIAVNFPFLSVYDTRLALRRRRMQHMEQNPYRTYSLTIQSLYNKQQQHNFYTSKTERMYAVRISKRCGSVHNCPSHGAVGREVCRMWVTLEISTLLKSPRLFSATYIVDYFRVVISRVTHGLCTRCPWRNGQLYTYP